MAERGYLPRTVIDRLLNESLLRREPGPEYGVRSRLATTPESGNALMSEMLMPDRGMSFLDRFKSVGTPEGGVSLAANLIGGPSLRGIRAFHGSPHKFDKFDMSRIGTGEGAQAYGHGLYFAENEVVARGYRDALKKDMFYTPGGQMFDPQSQLQHMNVRVAARNNGANLDATIARAQELLPRASEQTRPMIEHDLAVLRGLKDAGGISQNPGHMYEVNIRANPEQFLDWDRPLPTYSPVASKVHDASRAILDRPGGFGGPRNEAKDTLIALDRGNLTGQGAYHALARGQSRLGNLPNPEAANQALLAEGIPGIKYLDQGSRSAGQGSSNYVVFDDSIIDILKRYGIAGGLSPLVAASQGFWDYQQPQPQLNTTAHRAAMQ